MNGIPDGVKGFPSEGIRRGAASLFQWGGWIGSFSIYLFTVTHYDPGAGHPAPQWVGFTFIAALCVGVAGTMVRSRMRMTDAVIAAFKAGFTASQQRKEDRS